MPTFANREALSSVRAKLNSAIERVDDALYDLMAFTSRAEAIAATIPAPIVAISVLHNGRRCHYVYDAAGTALTTAGGRNWSPVAPVYLEHWGVTPSSTYTEATVDYTASVQAAALFANGDLIFTGWVKISDKVVAAAGCRVHCPSGHDRGGFVCRSDFNLAATSVFQPGSSAAEGSPIGDIGFWFEHTAATASGLRADLVQYPWAVGLAGPDITRSTFDRIRIMGAWNGVNAKGNAGGLKGHLIEISAFNEIGNINGVLDFCHIDNVHIWPFALTVTPTLRDLYYDGVASLNIGDCDGLHIDNLSTFRVKVVCSKTDNILPLTIGVVKLDGDGARWVQTSGLVTIAQLYSTKTTTPVLSSIHVSGGNLYVGTATISGGETVPQVLVDGGSVTMNGGELFQNSTNIICARVTSGSLSLNNLRLRWAETRVNPMIAQSGTGVLRMENVRPMPHATAQTLVSVADDVAGNFVNYMSMGIHILSVALTGPVLGRYITPTALKVLGSANNYPVGMSVTSSQTTETAAVADNLPALAGAGGDARWWVVDTSGQSIRTIQRATEVFGIGTTRGRTFMRVKQDSTWHAWTEL